MKAASRAERLPFHLSALEATFIKTSNPYSFCLQRIGLKVLMKVASRAERLPFHLSALEATFIKTSNPILCRQKEFVCNLKISHVSAEL